MENKMSERSLSWEQVKEQYDEKVRNKKIALNIKDLNTPELVSKYIEKYELYSSSAEVIFNSHINLIIKK